MDFKELLAYKKSFLLAGKIYDLTKSFPAEEKYALTSPIRKASRLICCDIAESFEKRESPELFFNQLTNSGGQIKGIIVLLQFARECNYINNDQYEQVALQAEEVEIMIKYMILNPEKFGSRKVM
uniref:four helix bundle protein n=1 Tax=uncultured Draconibacterium sp. TaxID=1573823 RepID=UPI0032162987